MDLMPDEYRVTSVSDYDLRLRRQTGEKFRIMHGHLNLHWCPKHAFTWSKDPTKYVVDVPRADEIIPILVRQMRLEDALRRAWDFTKNSAPDDLREIVLELLADVPDRRK